jgi:hypothetical protein
MKPSQAEVLLRIAENTYDDGDEVMAEMRAKLAAHARRVLADEELLSKAWAVNQADKARFASYMPQEHRQAGRQALGSNLAEQRAALAPVKKVADNA